MVLLTEVCPLEVGDLCRFPRCDIDRSEMKAPSSLGFEMHVTPFGVLVWDWNL